MVTKKLPGHTTLQPHAQDSSVTAVIDTAYNASITQMYDCQESRIVFPWVNSRDAYTTWLRGTWLPGLWRRFL